MKSLFFAIALNLSLTLALTACSSDAKKTETPKATEEKVVATAPKAAVTKSNPVAKKADKSTAPAANASTSANATTCTSGADTRSLAISTLGNGCELMYTKNSEAKSIATAVNESAYCAGVSEKVVKNLTAAGFSCK